MIKETLPATLKQLIKVKTKELEVKVGNKVFILLDSKVKEEILELLWQDYKQRGRN